MVFATMVAQAVANPSSRIHGREAESIFAATDGERGPERMLDFLVRTGPYGDGYGSDPEGVTLAALQAAPHGIDLGALTLRLPQALATVDGMVDLAPALMIEDASRLSERLDREPNGHLLLVGRRDLRSNNSWMHNLQILIKGKERCTLQIHPNDAQRLGLHPDGIAKVISAAGSIAAPVQVTEEIMQGVVSLPHGWGHDMAGTALNVAKTRPGVNSNTLATGEMDPLSGNAILNGIPVEVTPA
jgi:anaerobic selenocysteine-containing dehydrogenase